MATYKELLQQQQALTLQIEEARQREIADAVAQVRGLVSEYGLTAQDVFPSGRGKSGATRAGGKVVPKYRDPATARPGPVAARRPSGSTARIGPSF